VLGHGFVLHFRGVRVNESIAFESNSITGQDILNTENVELRRVLIERVGYEKFIREVAGIIRDRDLDAGGERQLIYIPFEDDELFVVLKVICPSTRHIHILRVPPYKENCHQAAAWIAGFNNPDRRSPYCAAQPTPHPLFKVSERGVPGQGEVLYCIKGEKRYF
jgi:hypothetical protein